MEFLTGDPLVDRRSVQLLLDTMAEVGATPSLENLLVNLVDKSIEVTRSERGFLLLKDEKDPSGVEVRVARSKSGRTLEGRRSYSTSVVARVLESREPLASVVQSRQDALDLGQSVYDLKLRAVMCVPLEAGGQLSGVIYVDSKAQRKEFSGRDLAFFAALAQQMAVSLENARLHEDALEAYRLSKELEFARHIQEQLLPEPSGLPEGVEVRTWYQAAEAASGDTYDVIVRPDGSVGVLLGDVSGHGIGPALIAHSAQAALRSYFELTRDLADIVHRLNDRFARGMETGSFMSLLIAEVSRGGEGGSGRVLRYINAGHGGAYVCTKEGVREVETSGPAIGMMGGFDYDLRPEIELDSGDFLFLCSDGLTEARNPLRDMLGEAPVLEVLAGCHGQGAAAAIEAVRRRADEHLEGLAFEDDVMLLVLSVR